MWVQLLYHPDAAEFNALFEHASRRNRDVSGDGGIALEQGKIGGERTSFRFTLHFGEQHRRHRRAAYTSASRFIECALYRALDSHARKRMLGGRRHDDQDCAAAAECEVRARDPRDIVR
jgi:hypothetical protein